MADAVNELARDGVLSELLDAADSLHELDNREALKNKFIKSKEAFERKGFKVNHGRVKVMVSGSISKNSLSKSKVGLPWVSSLRVKANLVSKYNAVSASSVDVLE